MELSITLSSGWLDSGKTIFLVKNRVLCTYVKMAGHISVLVGNMRGSFSDLHCENLVGLLEVTRTKCRGPEAWARWSLSLSALSIMSLQQPLSFKITVSVFLS